MLAMYNSFSTELPRARNYPGSSISSSSSNKSGFHVSEGNESTGHDSELEVIVVLSPHAHDQQCDLSGHTSNS